MLLRELSIARVQNRLCRRVSMRCLFAFALIATSVAAAAGARAGAAEGRWLTQEKSAVVEIYRCGENALCGRLVWLRMKPTEDNPHAVDIHNPAPALRNRPLCGLPIMWGLEPEGPDRWAGGTLYDPESGNTYSGKITLNPDGTLSLRGYLGISLLGRSQNWTRFTQSIDRCPAE
jgi:uncharacterized protein (DUF2147 family)